MGVELADSLLTPSGLYLELGGRPVLQGLDLRIRPGEIHGLRGANGSGKTTRQVLDRYRGCLCHSGNGETYRHD